MLAHEVAELKTVRGLLNHRAILHYEYGNSNEEQKEL
jgi:hypothetical protein